ncbi:MAG TPA: sulfite exporter TauE/SafE family protein [Patescibacteria group bacterium]|nr:sulfite exporter TauE/SafE family protein [Patescibacteria group bacterium]
MISQIFWVSLLTISASAVGTISGFGISTLMVPIMLFFLPYAETLLFVGVVHWFGDVWKIFLFKKGLNWKILLAFGIPGVIAAYIGASLTFELSTTLLSRAVGIFLIIYVLFITLRPKFKIKPNTTSAFIGGGLSGLLGGLTGVGGGAVRAVVLTAFNLQKEIYVFTTGIVGATVDASRIAGYFVGGTKINHTLLIGLPFFILMSFLGVRLGKVMVDKIPQEKFRYVVAFFLLAIGIKFAIFP